MIYTKLVKSNLLCGYTLLVYYKSYPNKWKRVDSQNKFPYINPFHAHTHPFYSATVPAISTLLQRSQIIVTSLGVTRNAIAWYHPGHIFSNLARGNQNSAVGDNRPCNIALPVHNKLLHKSSNYYWCDLDLCRFVFGVFAKLLKFVICVIIMAV